jgi:hypothetical protein
LSPTEIKKAARKAGMVDAASIETEIARAEPPAKGSASAQPAAADAAKQKPLIIKTAAVTESAPRPTVALAKTAKFEKQPKKQTFAE